MEESTPLAPGWRRNAEAARSKPQRVESAPTERWDLSSKFMATFVFVCILVGVGVSIGTIVNGGSVQKSSLPSAPPSGPPPFLPPPSPPAAANSLYEALFSVGGAPVTVGVAGATVDVRLQRSETGLSNQKMELYNFNSDASAIATSGCALKPNSLTNAVQDPASVAIDANTNFLKTHTSEGGRTSLTHAIRFQVQLDGAASVCEVTLLGSAFRWLSGAIYISNMQKTFALPMSGDSDER